MTHDENVLRELAKSYKEASSLEINAERKMLQTAAVDLHMIRPVILIDELPWHELNSDGELTLLCEDPFLREIEQGMRQLLYRFRHIPGDLVLPNEIKVNKIIHSSGRGLDIQEETISSDEKNKIVSHRFFDQMQDESCLEKFHNEIITYDREASENRYQLIQNILGDILPVRLVGSPWVFDTLWDDVAQLHGVENTLIDFLERPEYMHAVAEKLTDIFLDKVRQYEELNLFEGYQDSVHCTAAYTNDLPSPECDGVHFKAKDVWGRGAAQMMVSASPAMREEFDIPYMEKAMDPFGLVYYGCCEPLHNQIDIVSRIPHLRKITVTPWADYEKAAEQIGGKYMFGAKAHPANVALGHLDEERIRNELETIMNACKKNNCSFEIVLKDVSTVSYHPEVLQSWERIAMELAKSW